MNYYNDVYLKRLNRFGTDFQSRVQGKREYSFDRYVERSIYKVDFLNKDEVITGVLQPYKQDETETLQHLLVSVDYEWPGGTIFDIKGNKWMIVYLVEKAAKGYNKYIVLKMSHIITWKDRDGEEHISPCYFYGPMTEKIYDMLRTYLRGVVYKESNKFTHLIMPRNDAMLRTDYIEIEDEAFEVTGYDKVSTSGVMYVSLNQTHIRDNSAPPEKTDQDEDSDFFWLTGE